LVDGTTATTTSFELGRSLTAADIDEVGQNGLACDQTANIGLDNGSHDLSSELSSFWWLTVPPVYATVVQEFWQTR
jgi:hypothetical protein